MQELAEEWGVDVEDALQEYVQQLEAALAERETQRQTQWDEGVIDVDWDFRRAGSVIQVRPGPRSAPRPGPRAGAAAAIHVVIRGGGDAALRGGGRAS